MSRLTFWPVIATERREKTSYQLYVYTVESQLSEHVGTEGVQTTVRITEFSKEYYMHVAVLTKLLLNGQHN